MAAVVAAVAVLGLAGLQGARQDTTVDVRAITGVGPGTAVAARIPSMPGTPAEHHPAWLLMSPDPDLAADPWNDPGLAAAVLR